MTVSNKAINRFFSAVIHYMLVFENRRERLGKHYVRTISDIALAFPEIWDLVNGRKCLFCGKEFKDKRSLAIHLVKRVYCRDALREQIIKAIMIKENRKGISREKRIF